MENLIIMKFTNFYLEENDLTNMCINYLNKDSFPACFVYLILSPKNTEFHNNIKNVIFFILSSNVT
jgi:hypothetical protein